ncbi:hypothetical protein ACHMW4_19170 [Mesorhizobium sp. UC22_110]
MASVADGINAGRETIKLAEFHLGPDERGQRMQHGIDGLKMYRRTWDDDRKSFVDSPVKDWAEHIGSSFRYLGLAWRDVAPAFVPKRQADGPTYQVTATGVVRADIGVKAAVEAMMRRKKRMDG